MWEFRFYSRGGQGAVTAAKILTNAAIIEGKFAQAIPSYGQERKGAPIHTYGRISDEPIEVKSYVYRPNCVICFDTSLADVGIDITEGIRPGCTLVVNSPVPVYEDVFAKVCSIDADKLTHEILGEVPPNVAMLGALVKATGCVSIESLLQAIKIKIPGKAGENNAKACAESIKHSIKYLYVPSEDNDAWSQLYNNSSIKDPQAKRDLENVTFGMTLPNYSDYKYQVTAKNGNKAKLNFHQKGSFVTTYTNDDSDEKKGSTYSSRHMYAGECAHISNPMGEFHDKEDGKVRLRILHVDTSAGYVVFGLNSQKINTQSGFGIYKVAIQSKGSLKLKKTSANTTMTNGNSCYSLANAEYGVYTEKACTNKVATLKTDANGNSKVVEVDAGTYYVKGARRFLINERS